MEDITEEVAKIETSFLLSNNYQTRL